jgi:hypothetical protein
VRIYWDDHELRNLEHDLSGAPGRMQRNAVKVLARGGRLINREMKKDARGHRRLPHLPDAVSNEFTGLLEQEIGLSPGGQGSLAHIIAYGSVNNAPVYDHTAGLRRAEPRIVEWFADAAEESVLGKRGAA